ncbi:Uncharacterised protein [Arachnia propionica]|uniref:Uncharacterized protein n=1 Tax=Arachnia propionica TaxID=1750 RepID=A0A448N2I0_9ACTN|nr:Uncharacterised protein [Arachnia propionica]
MGTPHTRRAMLHTARMTVNLVSTSPIRAARVMS